MIRALIISLALIGPAAANRADALISVPPPPVVAAPAPVAAAAAASVTAENAAITASTLIETGAAQSAAMVQSIVTTNNHFQSMQAVNENIAYWQAIQLTDPGNGDTPGTLGYFAVSARDFFSQIGDLYDFGAPPPFIVEQWNIWSAYTQAQAGKALIEMQPIDLWWQENGPL